VSSNEPLRLGQILRKSIRESRDRSRFDAAARRAMAGKSRDEAREILIGQFRREGKEIPGEPFLDMRLDLLLAPNTPVERAKLHIDAVGTLIRAGGRLKGLVTDPDSHSMYRSWSDIFIEPDWTDSHRVLLDENVQDWIGDVPITGLVDFRDLSVVGMLLEASGERDAGGQIVALVDGRRAGVLHDLGSEPFWELMASGPGPSAKRASTMGVRTKDSQGLWRLDVGGVKSVRYLPRRPSPEDRVD
jgi:hypothetical protein